MLRLIATSSHGLLGSMLLAIMQVGELAPAAPSAPAALPAPPPSAPAPPAPGPASAPLSAAPAAPSAQGGARPGTNPAKGGPGEPEELTLRLPRATRTMDSMASSSAKELRIVGTSVRYSLNIFGDLQGKLTSASPQSAEPTSTFLNAGFNALFGAQLGGGFDALSELFFESEDTGETVADAERLVVRWRGGPFAIAAGRMHTDFGYFNNAYHHGTFLQLPVRRPAIILFEDFGGILPTHVIGLQASVKASLDAGVALNGTVAVVNTRNPTFNSVPLVNSHMEKGVFTKLELVGSAPGSLRGGVAALFSWIPPASAEVRPALPDTQIQEIVSNVYLAYPHLPFNLDIEGYSVMHRAAGRTWVSWGGFAVAGYAIGDVTPYLMVDFIKVPSTDPYFWSGPGRAGPANAVTGTGGLRVDLTPWCTLKGQYELSKPETFSKIVHSGSLSWSFGI